MRVMLLVILACCATLRGSAEAWDNVSRDSVELIDGRYEVYTPAQLAWLSDLSKTNSFEGTEIRLMADIDMGDFGFPIFGYNPSVKNMAFSGCFNGNGYSLVGVHLYLASDHYLGIFYALSGATIKHLTVDAFVNLSKNCIFKNGLGVMAGIVFGNKESVVTNCHVSSSLYYNDDAVQAEAAGLGGLVGLVTDNNTQLTISDCTVSVDYDLPMNRVGGYVGMLRNGASMVCEDCLLRGTLKAHTYLGGFVGRMEKRTNEEMVTKLKLTRCGSSADIEGIGGVGGLVGDARSIEFDEVFSTGSVVGDISVGGGIGQAILSGDESFSLSSSYSTAHVTSRGKWGGGIVGTISNGNNSVIYCSNSYFGGTLEASTSSEIQCGAVLGSSFQCDPNAFQTLYYGASCADRLLHNDYGTSVDSLSSKDFLSKLGDSFIEGDTLPILSWQKPMDITVVGCESSVAMASMGDEVRLTSLASLGHVVRWSTNVEGLMAHDVGYQRTIRMPASPLVVTAKDSLIAEEAQSVVSDSIIVLRGDERQLTLPTAHTSVVVSEGSAKLDEIYLHRTIDGASSIELTSGAHLEADRVIVDFTLPTNKWVFTSFPFVVDVAIGVVDPDTHLPLKIDEQWAAAEYDGQLRAEYGAQMQSQSWRDLTAKDSVLRADRGYLFLLAPKVDEEERTVRIIAHPGPDSFDEDVRSWQVYSYSDDSKPLDLDNQGWNLMGNPYPFAYDLATLTENPYVPLHIFYRYDYERGAYQTVDVSDGVSSLVMRPYEAVYLQTKDTLGIPLVRSVEKSAVADAPARLCLELYSHDDELLDQVVWCLDSLASPSFVIGEDALKMPNDHTNLYATDSERSYAIMRQPYASRYPFALSSSRYAEGVLRYRWLGERPERPVVRLDGDQLTEGVSRSVGLSASPRSMALSIELPTVGLPAVVDESPDSLPFGYRIDGRVLICDLSDRPLHLRLYDLDGTPFYDASPLPGESIAFPSSGVFLLQWSQDDACGAVLLPVQ